MNPINGMQRSSPLQEANCIADARAERHDARQATTTIDARDISDMSTLTAALRRRRGRDQRLGQRRRALRRRRPTTGSSAGSGNDSLDGGTGGDYLVDEDGNDIARSAARAATPGSPVGGTDTFAGGDGDDTVDYTGRSGAVTITLDGVADDGEAGELDTVGADVEGGFGGSGRRSHRCNGLGNRLSGAGGNDSITGGTARTGSRARGRRHDRLARRPLRLDRLRAGHRYAPGRPGRRRENCEIAPDRDGDGTLNEADCAPDNAAIHPGAGEIVGNADDEDCKDGPLYFKVATPISWTSRAHVQSETRFITLRVRDLNAGDKVEIRCVGGKSKRCAFTQRPQRDHRAKTVDVAKLLKKRYLKRNARSRSASPARTRSAASCGSPSRARHRQERVAVPECRGDMPDALHLDLDRLDRLLAAGIAGVAVSRGSISSTWVSSSAFGQCSTPRGTTNSSPGSSTTSRSRNWIVNRPATIRKSSSVSSCLCQTNSPCVFTTDELVVVHVADDGGLVGVS